MSRMELEEVVRRECDAAVAKHVEAAHVAVTAIRTMQMLMEEE